MRLALLGLLLGGCTLVDQTTFDPDAGKRPTIVSPPAPVVAAAPDPRALLTAHFPAPPNLQADVTAAVTAARKRKPDVAFEVVEVTAAGPDPNIGADAAAVARLITAAGIPSSRIRLSVRPTPGVAREVRVYVH